MIEEHDRALEVAAAVREAAHTQGASANALAADAFVGGVAARRGDLAEAEEQLRPATELGMANGMVLVATTGVWYLRDALVERPSLREMAAWVGSSSLPAACARTPGGSCLALVRARLAPARGDRAAAAADLRLAAEVQGALG